MNYILEKNFALLWLECIDLNFKAAQMSDIQKKKYVEVNTCSDVRVRCANKKEENFQKIRKLPEHVN